MNTAHASRTLKIFFFLLVLALFSKAQALTCELLFSNAELNPFRELLVAPEKPIRFDLVKPESIEIDFAEALQSARTGINAITAQTRRPNFKNTIAALNEVNEPLEIVASLLSHMTSVNSTPELRALNEKWMSKAQDLQNEINFNAALFGRVRDIFERRHSMRLSREQMTIVESLYRGFVSNGANLGEADKARVAAVDGRLTKITQDFSNNLTGASAKAKLTVTDETSLAGIPADVLAAAKELALTEGNPTAWTFTLKGSTPGMLQMYAENRNLRETVWKRSSGLNSSGEFDNRALVLEIVKLRQERAQILGFRSHAEFVTADRMAGTPEAVIDFITDLSREYKPGALKDAAELQEFATSQGSGPLAYWDMSYYTNKLRKARYDFDSEQLRPYLTLEAVHQGSLRVAERLFEIQFVPEPNVNTWADEVRVYRVIDKKDNTALGLFYFDPFTRDGKRPGAWMNTLVTGGEWGGRKVRPHVVNEMNFAAPAKGSPALLSLDDATTVFHELGHGLHGLLSKTRYRVTASPQIAWDVVELPSQLFESWLMDPATLQSFAKHYKTGEVLPLNLIEKAKRAENFRVASGNLGALRYAALDMAWYSGDISKVRNIEDLLSFEQQVTTPYLIYPHSGVLISPTFGHIFSGGYSAGYYSYKWADVLVADAWELFESEGIYNKKVAARYRSQFLAKGGAENAATLYERFRGRPVDSKAVLRREGLLPKEPSRTP
ncbi:M3 family metallopeptidase [soil metagenome]